MICRLAKSRVRVKSDLNYFSGSSRVSQKASVWVGFLGTRHITIDDLILIDGQTEDIEEDYFYYDREE